MINQLKNIPVKTIIWYIFFCIIGLFLYVNIISYWRVYIHFVGLSGLPALFTIAISGNIFAALILASTLAAVTKQRSFALGFSFGIIVIIQAIVIAPLPTDSP